MMGGLKIVPLGTPALRLQAAAFTIDELCSEETKALLRDMISEMQTLGGIGIAGTQRSFPLGWNRTWILICVWVVVGQRLS